MDDRKLPAASDPGVTMMLAGKLKAAEEKNARLRAEVERLRGILRGVVKWSEDTFHAQAHCHMCDQTGDLSDLHDEHCPVLLARDALAREERG